MKKNKIYRITDFESAQGARVWQKVGEICREYGGMTLSELYRVKELEEENALPLQWEYTPCELVYHPNRAPVTSASSLITHPKTHPSYPSLVPKAINPSISITMANVSNSKY